MHPGEDIEILEPTLDEALAIITSGVIIDAKTILLCSTPSSTASCRARIFYAEATHCAGNAHLQVRVPAGVCRDLLRAVTMAVAGKDHALLSDPSVQFGSAGVHRTNGFVVSTSPKR